MVIKIYDEDGNQLGLYDLCEYFIKTYPKDIFITKPKEIIKIRESMERILEGVKTGEYRE